MGTVTEIHDYLRLLFARAGTPYCPEHKLALAKVSARRVGHIFIDDLMNSPGSLLDGHV